MSGDSPYKSEMLAPQGIPCQGIQHESTQDGDVLYRMQSIDNGYRTDTFPRHHDSTYRNVVDHRHIRSLSGHFSGAAKLSDTNNNTDHQLPQDRKGQARMCHGNYPQYNNDHTTNTNANYPSQKYSYSRPQEGDRLHTFDDHYHEKMRAYYPKYGDSAGIKMTIGNEGRVDRPDGMMASTPPRPPTSRISSPSIGQKHRRVFSGGRSNPVVAHRRINSGGSSAFVYAPRSSRGGHQRSQIAPAPIQYHGHRRSSSDGLDMLSAAADVPNDELAAIAGMTPHYHHHKYKASSMRLGTRSLSPMSSYKPSNIPYDYKPCEPLDENNLAYPSPTYQNQPPPYQIYPIEYSEDYGADRRHHHQRFQVVSYNHPERPHHSQNKAYYPQHPQRPSHKPPYYVPNNQNEMPTNPAYQMRYVHHHPIETTDDKNRLDEENASTVKQRQHVKSRHRSQSGESSCGSDNKIETDEPLFSQKESIGTLHPSRIITARPRSSPTLFRASLRDSQQSLGSSPVETGAIQSLATTLNHEERNRAEMEAPRIMDDNAPYGVYSDDHNQSNSSQFNLDDGKHHRSISSLTNITMLGTGLFPEVEQSSNENKVGKDLIGSLSSADPDIPVDVKSEPDTFFTAGTEVNIASPQDVPRTRQQQSPVTPHGRIETPTTSPSDQGEEMNNLVKSSGNKLLGSASKRIRRKCSVPECNNRVVQGGLCISHGAKRKTCGYPGCTKNVKKAGMCSAHGPARKKCEYEGCAKVAVQGGKCIAHGAKKKLCNVENCTKQAILSGMCKKHFDKTNGVTKGKKLMDNKPSVDKSVYCVEVGSLEEASFLDSLFRDDKKTGKRTHVRGLSLFQDMNTVDKILAQDESNEVKKNQEVSLLPSNDKQNESPNMGTSNIVPVHKRGLSFFVEDEVADSIIQNPSLMGKSTADEDP